MIQFGLQPKYRDTINRVFAQYPNIEQVVVYGSRAKGNFRNGSGIDLTIIDSNLSFTEFLEIENKLDDLLMPYTIDLSQKRKISNPDLIEHINRVGQILYNRNSARTTVKAA